MTVTARYVTPLLDELKHLASQPEQARLQDAWTLLRRGTDVNAQDRDGRTALHQAMLTPQVTAPFLRALLSAGAEVNARDKEHRVPLHHAAARGDVAKARILIAAGADIGVNSDDLMHHGQTPLQTAVSYRQPAMVTLLLDQGAPVDQLGWNHRLNFCQTFTAFHLAVQTDQVTVMEQLLAAGANPDVPLITTDLGGPLPVSSTATLLELAYDAPQARGWVERRILRAMGEELTPAPDAPPSRSRRL